MKLRISDELSLPLDFVTQTQAILARKGAGKTNTAVVQSEELLKAGQQVVVIDPTGAWWGLKSSADGRHAGFPVVIFGGEHADAPLEESAGEIVAHAVVEQRFSAIIDLSLFRKGAMHRFMAAFLETLYRLNREAMHLVVDEADALAPQKPFGEEARTLGAMQDIVRRGRIRGIGCTLITQRPQVLNKDVLTQCEVLCTMRLTHPKDIGAIKEWIAVHGDERMAKDMIISLPALPIGTAWFWSPGWGDLFQKVMVRQRETFDSSATPKAGEAKRAPKVIAPVDILKLGEQIAATVQRQKENDPKQLKTRIAELEKQLAARSPEVDKATIERIRTEAWQKASNDYRQERYGLIQANKKLNERLHYIAEKALEVANAPLPEVAEMPAPRTIEAPRPRPTPAPVQRANSNGHGSEKLPKAERTILTVLAQYPAGRSKVQIAVIGGYAHSGGGFNNAVSALRAKGYIVGDSQLMITTEGEQALGNYQPLPTGSQLLNHWYGNLGKAERSILEALADIWPRNLSKEEVAARAGYEASGGGFNNAISRLRTLELINGRGELKASDDLFDGAA